MRFVRYLAVQIAAYGIDMGGFLVLSSYVLIGPLWANLYGKVFAGIFAFIAHRTFTFGIVESAGKKLQAASYFILLVLNIPISSAVLSFLLVEIPFPVLAKFVSDAICVLITYWLSKRYIFVHSEMIESQDKGVS